MASEGKQVGANSAGDGAKKITPKDVAAASAVGSAMRLGMRRHKGRQPTAATASGSPRKENSRGRIVTAAMVIVLTLGLLAMMILRGA